MDIETIKASVRLPKTSFSMKVNFSLIENKVLTSWKEKNIYNRAFIKNNREKFVLHDGPPYANGHLHVGHALNKILKDIIVKANSNMGYSTPFILGWDCHGLPIEWKIEEEYRKKKIDKSQVGIIEFRNECKEFANEWVNVQKDEFNQLGIIADFDNPYVTMDYSVEQDIVKNIFSLIDKNLIYQGKKPVLWSCIEQTALAEAEVEYKMKETKTVYCTFSAESSNEILNNAKIIIWTTTPWTLPANQALAYGPDILYGVYQILEVNDKSNLQVGDKVIVAVETISDTFPKFGIISFNQIITFKGLPSNLKAKHCLYGLGYDYTVPLLAADFVSLETGTAIVHIAPSHGEEDFYLCEKYNIIPKEIVEKTGIYKDNVRLFANEHIFKVEDKIIEYLQQNNSLVLVEVISHNYPHSWRSKAPLIYLLTSQWFISLNRDGIKEKLISSLENVTFIPEKGRNRLTSMIENRPDWCISRQRSWGVPMSFFIHKETHEILKDPKVFDAISEEYKNNGVDAWFKDPKQFLLNHNKDDYEPVMDIVDVWLDSGLSHSYVLSERKEIGYIPVDLYLEGSDQHRGWFQSSLITAVLLKDNVPYKKIVTHGFVLDEKGLKMSKSAGDAMMPNKVIKEYGADILRLWVASSNYKEDVNIGNSILRQQQEAYRKIRNTIRYLLSNIEDNFEKVEYKELSIIDKWILHRIYEIDNLFHNVFRNTFDVSLLYETLMNFIIIDLSAFYFDIKKDTLYCDAVYSLNYRATITVFDELLTYLFKWLSPIIPFTIEEAFSKRYGVEVGEMFLNSFPSTVYSSLWYDEKLKNDIDIIRKVRKVVLHAIEEKRVIKEIKSSLEASISLYLNKPTIDIISKCNFADICVVSYVNVINIDNINMKEVEDLYYLDNYDNIYVKICENQGGKCIRCWKYYDNLDENDICTRCANVLKNDKS